MEVMTLDEAIKREEEVAKGNKNLAEFYYKVPGRNTALGDSCMECAAEHLQLAEWLKELKQLREQTKWIPVSERLPEERDWYLAVFMESDTEFQLIPRIADYIGRGENKWRLIDENGLASEYWNLLECIAWIPLPKPYKTESEE